MRGRGGGGGVRGHSVFFRFVLFCFVCLFFFFAGVGAGWGNIPLQQFGLSSGQSGHLHTESLHHILIFNNPQTQYFLIFQAFKYSRFLSFYALKAFEKSSKNSVGLMTVSIGPFQNEVTCLHTT